MLSVTSFVLLQGHYGRHSGENWDLCGVCVDNTIIDNLCEVYVYEL